MFTSKKLIFTSDKKTRDAVLEEIAILLEKEKIAKSAKKALKDFIRRENQITTGVGDGIAMPHCLTNNINETKIIIVKLKHLVEWNSLDGKKVNTIIAIVNPKHGGEKHLELLGQISAKFIDSKFRDEFTNMSASQIEKMINNFKVTKSKTETKDGKYKVVAITSCPVGIAHTFMAAEALEKEAIKRGWTIKVEKQAAIGTKDKLSQKEIDQADYVIFAVGKEVEEIERFANKKVIDVPVHKGIREAPKIFDNLESGQSLSLNISSSIIKSKNGAKDEINKKRNGGWIRHALVGVSYMIPFVVVGGIFIALALGIGGEMVPGEGLVVPDGTFWKAIEQIGVAGFALMVPFLAAFIANSIAGRSAIAPAAIIAFFSNDPNGNAFFNYQSGEFGGFENPISLGFFGAILAGYLIGYGVKWFNNNVKIHKSLQASTPIFIIPLMFSFIGWFLFAFLFYLPIYYIGLGMSKGVEGLIQYNLFWIAGAILGAMICFDMGGPINKVAFTLGVSMIGTNPEVMGAVGASGAVAPLGCMFGILFSKYVFKVKTIDNEDSSNAVSAGIMGFIGISEGAIPFAIKYPKWVILGNVSGGIVAGSLAGALQLTNMAGHTGPIVYFLGAVGKGGLTDYAYGSLFLLCTLIGAVITGLIMSVGLKYEEKKVLINN